MASYSNEILFSSPDGWWIATPGVVVYAVGVLSHPAKLTSEIGSGLLLNWTSVTSELLLPASQTAPPKVN